MMGLRKSDASESLLHVSQEERLINAEEAIPLHTLRGSK
jgi:hypothetical protein